MFDIGWSEMAVIAVVALIVLGPKELPNALKTAAQWMRTARKLAREFQSGVDQIVREAELDEARKTVQQVTRVNIGKEIEKVVDPTGETRRELNTDPLKEPGPPAPAIAAPKPAAPTPPAASPAAASPEPAAAPTGGERAPSPADASDRNA